LKRTFCGRSTLASIAGLTGCIGFACVAAGEEKAASDSTPASAVAAAPVPGTPSPSIATSFPAIADPAGIRSALAAKGIQFGVNYIGDVFGNLTGGSRRGTVYEGRLELVIDADLEKLAGWQGGSFHANAYQIHGAGLSRYFIGNLMATSNIEALASTRLYETWVEQKLFDGKFALRAGQLGADSEFITSTNAGLFLNSTFGWPQITASDLPSGGPAYPLATPGARAKLAPNDNLALLVGVLNGDPAGRGVLDPQKRNRYGLDFRLSDPPFVIGEGQYKYGSEPGASGLPGTLKIGAWGNFGRFDDQHIGTDGRSLADPMSNGTPARLRSNQGIYGIIDQMVYRASADTPDKGIGVFVRASASPQDRNLIDFYIDGGANFTGLIAGRPDDAFGAAFAYARISDDARALDRDLAAIMPGRPTRDYEAVVELTYQAQILPGWSVQPDFQYIFHPGGHVTDPRITAGLTAIRDSAVFGLRTTINY